MMGTHASYVDSLHSAHSTVVFELQTGEVAQRIGNGQGAESPQLVALEHRRRNGLAHG